MDVVQEVGCANGHRLCWSAAVPEGVGFRCTSRTTANRNSARRGLGKVRVWAEYGAVTLGIVLFGERVDDGWPGAQGWLRAGSGPRFAGYANHIRRDSCACCGFASLGLLPGSPL